MAHSSLRPFVTRMLLEASPLRPSAPGLSDIMRREAGGYELVFVPRELKKGVMDVTEAASRLASLGLEPSDFLKDALSGQDLSKSRVYASLVPRWRAGWVPTAAQRKTIAKEELEDLSRRLQAEASKNGAASYSRETNEATRVGQLLGPRTELTEVEEKQRKQLEEQDRLAAKVRGEGRQHIHAPRLVYMARYAECKDQR